MDNAKMIALDRLHDSPFQPRKKYPKIKELAESMKELGVLQPLLVRLTPSELAQDGWEIIAGHRRKRGAVKAGLKEVPCVVVRMDDQEVREAILIENGQREDVPPLDELDIYLSLRADGMEPEEIGARIGRPAAYVYRRLQLNNLGSIAKAALAAGELGLGIAEMIARIPDEDVQQRATESLMKSEHTQPTIALAKDWIERHTMRVLKDADFDVTDLELLADAPPCGTCPKNTAVATNLFPEMEEDARCTDHHCYTQKRDATWDALCIAAEEKGLIVLDPEAAAKTHPHGYLHASWIDLDSYDWVKGKRKKWRTIIGKKRMPEKIYLVRAPQSGNILELVKKKEVHKKVKAAPKEDDPAQIVGKVSEYEQKQQIEHKIKKQYEHSFVFGVATAIKANKLPGDLEFWRMLAHGVVARSWAANISGACKRRKIEPTKESRETYPEILTYYIDAKRTGRPITDGSGESTATVKDLQMLVMELLTVPEFTMNGSFALDSITSYFAIPVKDIQAQSKHDVTALETMKADKKAAKAAGMDVDSYRAKRRKDARAAKAEAKKKNGKKKPIKITPAIILKKVEDGMTQAAVAEEIGLSRGQIARLLKKARAEA